MFQASGYSLSEGHLDVSFRDPANWTRVSADEGSPPSQWFRLGDPDLGPAVQLGMCAVMPQAIWLDTHYHASDQFRAVIRGGFQLQKKHMKPGDFSYQVAGVPYREGLTAGGDHPLWMFAVHGLAKGARSTLTRQDGSFELGVVAEDQLDRHSSGEEDPCWQQVPGGAKGVRALAVNSGKVVGGFHWNSFADGADWPELLPGVRAQIALLGDAAAGPVLIAQSAVGGQMILPDQLCNSETVIVVVQGAIAVGTDRLRQGDVRICATGTQTGAVIADDDGASLILLIADRRRLPSTPQWTQWSDALQACVASLTKQMPLAA